MTAYKFGSGLLEIFWHILPYLSKLSLLIGVTQKSGDYPHHNCQIRLIFKKLKCMLFSSLYFGSIVNDFYWSA